MVSVAYCSMKCYVAIIMRYFFISMWNSKIYYKTKRCTILVYVEEFDSIYKAVLNIICAYIHIE